MPFVQLLQDNPALYNQHDALEQRKLLEIVKKKPIYNNSWKFKHHLNVIYDDPVYSDLKWGAVCNYLNIAGSVIIDLTWCRLKVSNKVNEIMQKFWLRELKV